MKTENIIYDRDRILGMLGDYPVLVTTSNWFYDRDGQQYNGVWGKAKIMSAKSLLGFDPSSGTNWMMVFDGGPMNTMVIGGCQINYIKVCPEEPTGRTILKVFPEPEQPASDPLRCTCLEKAGDTQGCPVHGGE